MEKPTRESGGHTSLVRHAIRRSVLVMGAKLLLDRPWTLTPSVTALAATSVLLTLCTGIALPIYFKLVHTLGSMDVTSQAYLRAGVGVMPGLAILGETLTCPVAIGLFSVIGEPAVSHQPPWTALLNRLIAALRQRLSMPWCGLFVFVRSRDETAFEKIPRLRTAGGALSQND